MDYLVDLVSGTPLRVRFSFYQPNVRDGPAFVPRLLRPLGYFARITIRTLAGEIVFRTIEPKVEPKLDPANDASYLALESGYSYGVLLEVERVTLTPGDYVLALDYNNRQFTGSPRRPVGVMRYETTLDLRIDS